jgi:hypothetical protein
MKDGLRHSSAQTEVGMSPTLTKDPFSARLFLAAYNFRLLRTITWETAGIDSLQGEKQDSKFEIL